MSPSDTAAAPAQGWQDHKLVLARELDRLAATSDAAMLAMRFAALSGKFRPEHALAAAGYSDAAGDVPSMDRLAAIANLSDSCDTRIWRPDWIMRGAPRARIIEGLASALQAATDWRRAQQPFDEAAQEIVDALLGQGRFTPEAISAALEDPALSVETCRNLIRGITFALPLTPVADRLDALRAALARVEAKADPEAKLVETGIYGREAETADIGKAISDQWDGKASPGLGMAYIGGIGGVGKSTLMAEVRRLHRNPQTVCATLDFDRPGIEGGDPLGLSRELARQVADLVGAPAASLYSAITAASGGQSLRGETDRTRTQYLLGEIGAVMRQQDLAMLLTLDTMESLTLHGDTAAFGLLEWLRILKQLLPRLAIVAAGRETMPATFASEARPTALSGLPDQAALKLLEAQGVTGKPADDLVALAKGNPLVLRLGAKVAGDGGSFSATGEISAEASAQMKAGQLYRLILSRIDSPELRALAHPGLLLRQINARMLMEVVAPEVGLGPIDEAQAKDLLERLKRHVWLVEQQGDWLCHRSELRAVLLDLQIAENPGRARRIFAAAALWHARNKDTVLALYYRLQDMRWTKRAPKIDPEAALRFTKPMIEELPQDAKDLLATARGERSSRLRAEDVRVGAAGRPAPGKKAESASFSMSAAQELRGLLDRRNYAEATAMVSRAGDFAQIDPDSPAGGTVIEALWRAGDWARARALVARRRRPGRALPGDDDMRLVPAFADIEPERFRLALRTRPEWARSVAATLAKQDPRSTSDWDVVGLLLRAEGIEEVGGFAHFVWEIWTGDPLAPDEIAQLHGELLRLSARAQQGAASPASAPALQDLVRLLMPDPAHALMLQNRLQCLRSGRIDILPLLAQATLAALGDTPEGQADIATAASFAIDTIDARGALAHFTTALATLQPGSGVQHLALAARRRMAAAAGYWTYGDVPQGWRQPATDWRTLLALSVYSGSVEAAQARAKAELDQWREGYGTPAASRFAPLVKRATDIAQATPLPLIGTEAANLAWIAQKLIDRGVPLSLAPPLAVLEQGKSPLSATAGTPPTPNSAP